LISGAAFDAGAGEEVVVVRPSQLLAGVGVAGLALMLAVLPSLVASGLVSGVVTRAAVGLGCLVAIWGGVKSMAAVLGVARHAGRVLVRSDD